MKNTPYVKQYNEKGELTEQDFPIRNKFPNRRARRLKNKSMLSEHGKLTISPKLDKNGKFIGFQKVKSRVQLEIGEDPEEGLYGKMILHYD